jgi:dihydropteroate synthase
MHMKGNPQTMQHAPQYADLFAEVRDFLRERAAEAEQAGIRRQRLCVDPGYGFGKTVDHNLKLLAWQAELQQDIGLPLLAGLSRKSTIGHITGKPVEQRLAGSIGGALVAAMNGARIVRVHDVAETVDALKVWDAARRAR